MKILVFVFISASAIRKRLSIISIIEIYLVSLNSSFELFSPFNIHIHKWISEIRSSMKRIEVNNNNQRYWNWNVNFSLNHERNVRQNNNIPFIRPHCQLIITVPICTNWYFKNRWEICDYSHFWVRANKLKYKIKIAIKIFRYDSSVRKYR